MVRNLTLILLGIVIMLFGSMTFFFWFWNGLYLKFDSTIFNNIATPIAAIVSAILFLFLACRQNSMLETQNEIIISQNVKPSIEREFSKVEEILKNKNKNMTFEGKELTNLETMSEVYRTVRRLRRNNELNDDVKRVYKGEIIYKWDLDKKSYYKDVLILENYTKGFGMIWLDYVTNFIEMLEYSKLHEVDKDDFKRRIRSEFLIGYMYIMKGFDESGVSVTIPTLFDYDEDGKVNFIQFHKTSFREPYDYYKQIFDSVK